MFRTFFFISSLLLEMNTQTFIMRHAIAQIDLSRQRQIPLTIDLPAIKLIANADSFPWQNKCREIVKVEIDLWCTIKAAVGVDITTPGH